MMNGDDPIISIETEIMDNTFDKMIKKGYDAEEIYGAVMDRLDNLGTSQLPYHTYENVVNRMLPFIIDEMDKKYEEGLRGEKLVLTYRASDFLRELGGGRDIFLQKSIRSVVQSIREILIKHGLYLSMIQNKYFIIKALDETEAQIIEKRFNRKICKSVSKEVCEYRARKDDRNSNGRKGSGSSESIFDDIKFLEEFTDCKLQLDKIDRSVKKRKIEILKENIRDGLELLEMNVREEIYEGGLERRLEELIAENNGEMTRSDARMYMGDISIDMFYKIVSNSIRISRDCESHKVEFLKLSAKVNPK